MGKHFFFLFLLKNIDCGYSLESHRRGGSNEYLQSMFCAEKISEFLSKLPGFGSEFLYIYLNRCVFVMSTAKVSLGEHVFLQY